MLYFTFSEKRRGPIRAIYNGRFAFVSSLAPQTALALVRLVGSSAEAEARSSLPRTTIDALDEEFQHVNYFAKTESGLLLSGLRFLARLDWLVTKREDLPRLYYRLRTQYFLKMYDLQEDAVQAQPPGTLDSQETAIRRADFALMATWRPALQDMLPSGGEALARALGAHFAKHFTVVTADVTDPGRTATNVSLGGFANTSGSFGRREGTALERLLVHLRPEAWIAVDEHQLWRWARLKFQEERRTIKGALGESGIDSIFQPYVQRVLVFLTDLFLLRELKYLARLEAVLLQADETLPTSFPKQWRESAEIRHVLGFFYGHGN